MVIHIVFETHSFSEDNELGIASGWHHSRLSERGQRLARELGKRRIADAIQACSPPISDALPRQRRSRSQIHPYRSFMTGA